HPHSPALRRSQTRSPRAVIFFSLVGPHPTRPPSGARRLALLGRSFSSRSWGPTPTRPPSGARRLALLGRSFFSCERHAQQLARDDGHLLRLVFSVRALQHDRVRTGRDRLARNRDRTEILTVHVDRAGFVAREDRQRAWRRYRVVDLRTLEVHGDRGIQYV